MNNKKQILIITNILHGKGGEEEVLKIVLNRLVDLFDLKLFVSEAVGKQEWLTDVNSAETSIHYGHTRFTKIAALVKQLIFFKGDIVISMSPKITYIADQIRKIWRKKYRIVGWYHFSLSFDSISLKKFYKFADMNLAISSGIQRELNELGIPLSKIKTIYNPVIPSSQTIEITDKGPIHFIMASRIQFEGQKNLKEALTAASMVTGDFKLDIYGADTTDGQTELKKCLKYVSDLKLENVVSFKGWTPNVWENLDSANALLLSSNYEGFPMVLCEAIARGLPVISANCPTGPADIVNEDNGFLYPSHDVNQLRNRMQSFVDCQNQFNSERVKESIAKFYVDKYIYNLKHILLLT